MFLHYHLLSITHHHQISANPLGANPRRKCRKMTMVTSLGGYIRDSTAATENTVKIPWTRDPCEGGGPRHVWLATPRCQAKRVLEIGSFCGVGATTAEGSNWLAMASPGLLFTMGTWASFSHVQPFFWGATNHGYIPGKPQLHIFVSHGRWMVWPSMVATIPKLSVLMGEPFIGIPTFMCRTGQLIDVTLLGIIVEPRGSVYNFYSSWSMCCSQEFIGNCCPSDNSFQCGSNHQNTNPYKS